MNFKNHIDNNINLDNIRNEISKHKIEWFLVGGYVRDMILSRKCKDIDIMTIGEPYKLVESISKIKGFSNFKNCTFYFTILIFAALNNFPPVKYRAVVFSA